MRKVMKTVCWLVFLAFIGLSSFANWEHGTTRISSFMLAVVPVGFAASVFILEGLISAQKASRSTFAAIGFVALASGVASYLGLFGMARDAGIPLVQAALLPLSFDGVVLVASMGIRGFSPAHVPTRPRSVSRTKAAAVPAAANPVTAAVPEVSGPNDKRDKAFRMLAEGRDKSDVAQTVGVSVRTLNRWITQKEEAPNVN